MNHIAPILVILIAAFLCSRIARALKIPRVVGQIFAGMILGSGLFASMFTESSLQVISFLSELGIILLFYYIGLETNFGTFSKNLRQSVLISLFNTSLPLIIGFVVMHFLFGFNLTTSIIIGIALSVSAQSISLDILEELKMVKSKIGSLIISAGAVDDIIELGLVTFILSFFDVTINNLDTFTFVRDAVIFLVIIIIARIWVIPTLLNLFNQEKTQSSHFMGSIIIVLLIALLSETLGIGSLIGAMIAGMIVRQTILKDPRFPDREEHEIAYSIHLIAFGLLIPIFFVQIGMSTDLTLLLQNSELILTMTFIAVSATVIGTAVAVRLGGQTWHEGFVLGWGLNPKGDVELVIASLALKAGIISNIVFTSLVSMAVITTIISPVVFRRMALRKQKK